MPRKKRISERHAAVRLVERCSGCIDLEELKRRLVASEVEYVMRQSVTRSLCRTKADDQTWVYMVVNRTTKSIITVLTHAQAEDLFRSVGRDPKFLNPKPA